MHALGILIEKLDDGEDKIIRLIEGVKNFVLRDGDSRGTRHAALHFEKTQPASARLEALDVVAELLKFPVCGLRPGGVVLTAVSPGVAHVLDLGFVEMR